MAELLGSALLSALFNVLFDRLAKEEVKNFLRPKKVVKKLLKNLKISLLSANALLDDAEEKLISNPGVEIWHNMLKDVVYKANELADKIETEALRRKLEGHQPGSNITKVFTKLCSNPLSLFDNDVKDELEGILSSLKDLLFQKDALGLEPAGKSYSGVTPAERSRVTPVADESAFFGREDIKETIIRLLQSDDVSSQRIAVIPIVGAGGLGKTTLVQIIYQHEDVRNHFPVRAWVTVSPDFDLPEIIKRMIRQVSDSSQIDDNVDQQILLFELNNALKGKRFLLVLDDVWSDNRDEWINLKSCFNSRERGSKIIVTTRSSRVASIAAPNQLLHLLPELHEEDCRRLFENTVFTDDQDRDAHPDLQEIGKKIVENCKGLPLSVKSVGGILCDKRDAGTWENILKSSVWELLQQNNRNIIPSLWLSYRYLPSEIKPCFAYCSIFPKDYQFKIEEVVRLWMAEGFLKYEAARRGITMEEVGKQFFEELISRSLFQCSEDSYRGDCFIMHDLVHDLAKYVSGKFCFWLDEDKMLHDLACETRHFSYNLAIGDAKKFKGLSKAKRLHTFVGFKFSDPQELDVLKVLEELSVKDACLRVLSLSSSYETDSLLASVGELKHLRHLNLSTTSVTKLPDSVGILYNLQTLLLSGCTNLTRLPNNLGKLINLHHLDIRDSPKLEFLGDSRFGSLENLKIEKCEALKSISLDYFPKLNRFTLSECENFELFRHALVLESLTRLELEGLPKFESFPEGGLLAPNLKEFYISECKILRSLPHQMHSLLPSLNSLQVNDCGEIESWPEGGLPSNLESLGIWKCKKLTAQVMSWDLRVTCLKSFLIHGCGEELLDSFPPDGLLPTSLTSLDIRKFGRLKTLNIHAFQNLKELRVWCCDELQCLSEESPLLEERYRKETGEDWHKISHIPTVDII